MAHPLLDCETIDVSPRDHLRAIGEIFAEFGDQTQDSGNISYGVRIAADRFFVKTAGDPYNSLPYLDHAGRVALLRNVVRLNRGFQHALLAPLLRVIESPEGPLLVYPWIEGELLAVPRERRDDPASSFQRFRALPIATITACLDAIYDLHAALARTGWIAVDFYDGSLVYDFAAGRLHVVDIDHYSDRPFVNAMGRMFGSTRFMAPEEFERGAQIDEQTTVFTMGRTALVFLGDGTANGGAFRGSLALSEVVLKACRPERARRFGSMTDFQEAWTAAAQQPLCLLESKSHLENRRTVKTSNALFTSFEESN